MTIKIDKTERKYFEKAAAELSLKCQFYTMENNEQMIMSHITEFDGDQITLASAYFMGRNVGYSKASDLAIKMI